MSASAGVSLENETEIEMGKTTECHFESV